MPEIAVNEKRLITLTQQLVRINSEFSEGTVRNHYEIAGFLRDHSESIGLEVHYAEPEAGYPIVMAKLRGSVGKPVLAFIGHYNTHPIGDRAKWTVEPLGGEVRDGYIWGRGAGDMKKNIAAAIEATLAVRESGVELRGDVIHIWFAGEGHHDSALEYMAGEGREFAPVDWYLDVDWSEGGIAKVPGSWVWLEIRTQGLVGHSALLRGDGRKPINAISKMAHLICKIEDVDNWMSYEPHYLFGGPWRYSSKPIVEVNTIKGGAKVNEVADECHAMVDFRLLPGQCPETLLEELRGLIDRLRAEDEEFMPVDVQVSKTCHSRPWELTDDHPVVRAIREAAGPILGREPEWQGIVYGSRPPLWQVGEVIHFGLAGGRNYHAEDESTCVDALIKGARVYAGVIEKLVR